MRALFFQCIFNRKTLYKLLVLFSSKCILSTRLSSAHGVCASQPTKQWALRDSDSSHGEVEHRDCPLSL